MTDIMEARRKGFEVTAREHYFLHELDHSWSEREQEYHDSDMQIAWEVYNAALDSVCVELPKSFKADDGVTGVFSAMQSNEVIEALADAGLRVKP